MKEIEKDVYYQRYREDNAEKLAEYHRDWELRKKYGITREQYYAMVDKQNNLCACCGKPETAKHQTTRKPMELRVDWDKKNKRVRRLICASCQFSLSYLEKNKERVKLVNQYLAQVDGKKGSKT